jgi:hypothetical protein
MRARTAGRWNLRCPDAGGAGTLIKLSLVLILLSLLGAIPAALVG